MVCTDKSMGLIQKEKPEKESPRWERIYSRQSLQKQNIHPCHRSRKIHTAGCHVHSDMGPPLSVQLVGHSSTFVNAFLEKTVEEGTSPFAPVSFRRVSDVSFIWELFRKAGILPMLLCSIFKATVSSHRIQVKRGGKNKVEGIFICICRPLSEPFLLAFSLELFSVTLSNAFSNL